MARPDNYPQNLEGLLPYEREYVVGAFAVASANAKQAKLDYGEAVDASGGDWVFDDPASQIAMNESGMRDVTLRFYKSLMEAPVLPMPSAEEPRIMPGSRVVVEINNKFEDTYDIVTRRIPDLPHDPEVFATLSARSVMGQALLGAKVGDEINWTAESRTYTGVVRTLDQQAQSRFYEAQGLMAHPEPAGETSEDEAAAS